MNTVIDYKRKIYATRDLPTLPIIAQKILLLADDDECGADKLAKIITSDQSLSVKVLSLANSAYYGHRAQISTVKQALIVIGVDMLKQIALSVLVFKALDRGQKGRTDFWRHSLLAAHASSLIAKRTGGIPDDVCFMAGLLHDVGKLILVSNLPEVYDDVLALVKQDGCSLQEAEIRILETDHAEVGAWMAERWQLPTELSDAIRLHHDDNSNGVPHSRIVTCVRAANVLAQGSKEAAVPEDAVISLRLTPSKLDDIVRELEIRSEEIGKFLA
jgi:putative nucleotidyltransferase with HDIG domain